MKKLSLLILSLFVSVSGYNQKKETKSRPNVIFIITDDHGYNDLEATDLHNEVDLPNIHKLATNGVLMTQGYCTAPQCVPSRAGIITGRHQQKFGLDCNSEGPLPRNQKSIASRLKALGYTTCHVGKWHLEPNRNSKKWFKQVGCTSMADAPIDSVNALRPQGLGYDEYAQGTSVNYWSNFDVNGKKLEPQQVNYHSYDEGVHKNKFRLQLQTELSLNFISRQADKAEPFFLYLGYYGPHAPLDAPKSLTDQVLSLKELEAKSYDNTKKRDKSKVYAKPYTEAEIRQQALALLKGIDNGVGDILSLLEAKGELENTLIFFMSDNGAPLSRKSWNGSLNTPWYGSKGIIFEGGSRIPYIVSWKGVIKPHIYDKGVSTLDAGATAVSVAGGKPEQDPMLDGVNLIPFLTGKTKGNPHRYLYQRYTNTSSVVNGKLKFMRHENGEELLFDLTMEKPGANNPDKDFQEAVNLIETMPEKTIELRNELERWMQTLPIPHHQDGFTESLFKFFERWELKD